MHGKRWLTIACAAGILASGACFLPAPHQKLPPPPPLRVDLKGSKSIRVVVTNTSETHQINPDELGTWIVAEINMHKASGTPRARLGEAAAPHEAVLQVTVVKESATQTGDRNQYGYTQWMGALNLDATLTADDGAIEWRQTNHAYQYRASVRHSDVDDVWGNKDFFAPIRFSVIPSLVREMLFGAD